MRQRTHDRLDPGSDGPPERAGSRSGVIVAIKRVAAAATRVLAHDVHPLSNRIVEKADNDPFTLVGRLRHPQYPQMAANRYPAKLFQKAYRVKATDRAYEFTHACFRRE
jgi:hypothetical protein